MANVFEMERRGIPYNNADSREAVEAAREEEKRPSIPALFHKVWGDAHASPDYDKEVWKDLQAALRAEGIEV